MIMKTSTIVELVYSMHEERKTELIKSFFIA